VKDFSGIEARLIARRDEMLTRLSNIKSNLTRGRSADSQEQAQELENAEVVDALGNEAQHELHLIARALEQIRQGTFGVCAGCGEDIPRPRLDAQPFADRCIDCATADEQSRPRA